MSKASIQILQPTCSGTGLFTLWHPLPPVMVKTDRSAPTFCSSNLAWREAGSRILSSIRIRHYVCSTSYIQATAHPAALLNGLHILIHTLEEAYLPTFTHLQVRAPAWPYVVGSVINWNIFCILCYLAQIGLCEFWNTVYIVLRPGLRGPSFDGVLQPRKVLQQTNYKCTCGATFCIVVAVCMQMRRLLNWPWL
jgi:hypothetical protein